METYILFFVPPLFVLGTLTPLSIENGDFEVGNRQITSWCFVGFQYTKRCCVFLELDLSVFIVSRVASLMSTLSSP